MADWIVWDPKFADMLGVPLIAEPDVELDRLAIALLREDSSASDDGMLDCEAAFASWLEIGVEGRDLWRERARASRERVGELLIASTIEALRKRDEEIDNEPFFVGFDLEAFQ